MVADFPAFELSAACRSNLARAKHSSNPARSKFSSNLARSKTSSTGGNTVSLPRRQQVCLQGPSLPGSQEPQGTVLNPNS